MFGFLTLEDEEPAPVKLFRYRVLFWNSIEWEQVDVTLLATNKQQCETWAEAQCPLASRLRDYPDGKKDSLQVIKCSEVILPFEV